MASPPPDQVRLAQIYGRKYGVDPRVLLAIGGHETQWGRLGAGRQGYTLGYGATDSGTIGKYAGVAKQYRYAASTLARWGVHSIEDLVAGRAASYASDPHWEAGVASVYKSLGGPLPTMPAGAGASPALPSPAPRVPQGPAAPNFVASPQVLGTLRRSLASRQYADPMARIKLPKFIPSPVAAAAGTAVSPKAAARTASAAAKLAPAGGLAEAFYDPLGSYDNGRFGGAIGNHSDHVHLSITNPTTMLAAIRYAQAHGLRVGENPYTDTVDPVHVKGSFHYRDFPGQYGGKKLGEAIDVTGNPQQMAAYYRWATRRLR